MNQQLPWTVEVDYSAPESKSDDEDGDEEDECDGDGGDEEGNDAHGDADNGSQPTAKQLAMIGRAFRLERSHLVAAPAAERRAESRAAAACAPAVAPLSNRVAEQD